MRKLSLITVLILLVIGIGIGGYAYLTTHPPLETGTISTGNENTTVIIEIGNKGFSGIKIEEVTVNNDEKPTQLKVQVNNAKKGFIIAETFEKQPEEYGFTNIDDATIKKNTSISDKFEKINNGTATTEDPSYGLSVIHTTPITFVTIHYRYFGLSFEKAMKISLD